MLPRRSSLLAALLTLCIAAPCASAADAPVSPLAPATYDPGDWEALKTRLQATDEEWSIIFPQLWRIVALRDDLTATAATARPASKSPFDNVTPMGGTSLDAPEMPNRTPKNPPAAANNPDAPGPFDPKKAPGIPSTEGSPLLRAFGGLLIRTLVGVILPDQARPVQTVLIELKTLLNSPATTDDQLREKLATLRAVRGKALRDLAATQKQLTPYLTTDQTALLVTLGILE